MSKNLIYLFLFYSGFSEKTGSVASTFNNKQKWILRMSSVLQ